MPQPVELAQLCVDAITSGAAAEPFHKKLLDNLYDGVYFVDVDRTITYWNKGAERLTGFAAREAISRHCFDNFLMHVDKAGCALCLERLSAEQDADRWRAPGNGIIPAPQARSSCAGHVFALSRSIPSTDPLWVQLKSSPTSAL